MNDLTLRTNVFSSVLFIRMQHGTFRNYIRNIVKLPTYVHVARTGTNCKSVRRFTYDVPTDDLGTDGLDITDGITVGRNHDGTERMNPILDMG